MSTADCSLQTIESAAVKDKLEKLDLSGQKSPQKDDSDLVAALQRALLEVVEQNEKLQGRVNSLEQKYARAKHEIAEKDEAIVELAALVDRQMEGALTESLAEI